MDFRKPYPPTRRGSLSQDLEGLSHFLKTLEPQASCRLPTWVSEMLSLIAPSTHCPGFQAGSKPRGHTCSQDKVLGRHLRFEHHRGHVIFKDSDPAGNPRFNPAPPLTRCGILCQVTQHLTSKSQWPHLCSGEKKAHFRGVMGKSRCTIHEAPLAYSRHSITIS